ncbi:MAG: Gfo/Idh/MocA family oxidoreductase [Blastochloris sp.]|nr:Gfo/Idh/MocA family oxidoreductase [Blastochloris sp.]
MASKKTPSTPSLSSVRFGIVGLGNMGRSHVSWLLDNKVPGAVLTAVCDNDPSKLEAYPQLKRFTDSAALICSGEIDAILIATPHYDHTSIGINALKAGLHVLVEKPLSVHKADCERLIAAHTNKKQIFAAMFNQRTDPYYQKLRQLVRGGELGKIRRINWIITDWFRTETYYASGGWRATWGGEGGGVLLNQCPHNLDLYQWIFGMPQKVRGHCQLGRYHNIEVEDDVTAYFEYADGATGVFITSTGEAPGTNRLEVVGEQGKLVLEHNKLSYTRNEVPMSTFSRSTDKSFDKPPVWNVDIPLPGHRGEQHIGIMKNFTNAILKGETLLAPAPEGIHSVELGNAILMSSLLGQTIDVPLNSAKFEKLLKNLIAQSRFKKKVVKSSVPAADFASSFGR